MKVQIEIPDDAVESLIRYAVIKGFKRENPRLRWSEKEQKAAVRYALHVALAVIRL